MFKYPPTVEEINQTTKLNQPFQIEFTVLPAKSDSESNLQDRIKTASSSVRCTVQKKRGSSVVRHLPLVLEVPGSIPARGEKNFGDRTRFLYSVICRDDAR